MFDLKEVITLAGNPKTAGVVATATASTGFAAHIDAIQGWLSIVSMCIGIFTATIICAIQIIKLVRHWRAFKNGDPEP
jgi:hypothetical protein